MSSHGMRAQAHSSRDPAGSSIFGSSLLVAILARVILAQAFFHEPAWLKFARFKTSGREGTLGHACHDWLKRFFSHHFGSLSNGHSKSTVRGSGENEW